MMGSFLKFFSKSSEVVPLVEARSPNKRKLGEELLNAAASCDLKEVKRLIQAGADVDTKDAEWGNTPLCNASENGCLDVVKELIKAGADLDERDDGPQHTPLHLAFNSDHLEIVSELIQAGADVNARSTDEQTVLHSASCTDSLKTIDELIEAGADVNVKDEDGYTPAHYASANGRIDVIKKLMDEGADILARDLDGKTSVDVAKNKTTAKLIQKLIKDRMKDVQHGDIPLLESKAYNAAVTKELFSKASRKELTRENIQKLVAKGADLDDTISDHWSKDWDGISAEIEGISYGTTLLQMACLDENIELIEWLIEAGADVNIKDREGGTALHCSVESSSGDKMIKMLVEAGADVNVRRDNGETPLHMASIGYMNSVIALLKFGADPMATNNDGNTPLDFSNEKIAKVLRQAIKDRLKGIQHGDIQLLESKGPDLDEQLIKAIKTNDSNEVKRLIAAGADVNQRDDWGTPAIFGAYSTSSLPFLRGLIRAGADVNIKDKHGQSLLHNFTLNAHDEAIEEVLKAGADLNVRDNNGNTPLHRACSSARNKRDLYFKRIMTLIKAGADVNAQNNLGRTPLYFALWRSSTDTVEKLIQAGADGNIQDNEGNTPLHHAAIRGCTPALRQLLVAGADPLVVNNDGKVPLDVATNKKAAEQLSRKINKNVLPQVTDLGQELVTAARIRDLKKVKKLIAAGANPKEKRNDTDTDDHGWTALDHASANGSLEMVKELLRILNPKGVYRKNQYAHALSLAASRGHLEVVKVLIAGGADIDAKESRFGGTVLYEISSSDERLAMVKELIKAGADTEVKDKFGRTALWHASQYNAFKTVKELMESGANIEAQDDEGWTPLHVAAHRSSFDAMKELMEAEADPFAKTNDGESVLDVAPPASKEFLGKLVTDRLKDAQYGDIPLLESKITDLGQQLIAAVKVNDLKKVKELIRAGADLEAADDADQTSLYFAAGNNQLDIVKLLIEFGANIEAKSEDGWTPLHWASRTGHHETARELIKAGADLNARADDGSTPLHLAAANCLNNVVNELITAGANQSLRRDDGLLPLDVVGENDGELFANDNETLLHAAVREARLDVVEVLLALGVDPLDVDDGGETPLDLLNKYADSDDDIKDALMQAINKRIERTQHGDIPLLESRRR